MDLLTEIYESMSRNKLRIALTGFSIAWGIFLLIVLLSAGDGDRNSRLRGEDRGGDQGNEHHRGQKQG